MLIFAQAWISICLYLINKSCRKRLPEKVVVYFNRWTIIFSSLYYIWVDFILLDLVEDLYIYNSAATAMFYDYNFLIILIMLYLAAINADYKYAVSLNCIYSLLTIALFTKDLFSMFMLLELVNFLIALLFFENFKNNNTNYYTYIFNLLVLNFIVTSFLFLYTLFFYMRFGSYNFYIIFNICNRHAGYAFVFILIFLFKLNISPFYFVYSRAYKSISLETIMVYTVCSFMYLFIILTHVSFYLTSYMYFYLMYTTLMVMISMFNTNNKYDLLLLSSQIVMLVFLFCFI